MPRSSLEFPGAVAHCVVRVAAAYLRNLISGLRDRQRWVPNFQRRFLSSTLSPRTATTTLPRSLRFSVCGRGPHSGPQALTLKGFTDQQEAEHRDLRGGKAAKHFDAANHLLAPVHAVEALVVQGLPWREV